MLKTLYLIEDYHADYEDPWAEVRPRGYTTRESAEHQLLSTGYKRNVYPDCSFTYIDADNSEADILAIEYEEEV